MHAWTLGDRLHIDDRYRLYVQQILLHDLADLRLDLLANGHNLALDVRQSTDTPITRKIAHPVHILGNPPILAQHKVRGLAHQIAAAERATH